MVREWEIKIVRRDDDGTKIGQWQSMSDDLGELAGELIRAAMHNMFVDSPNPIVMLSRIANELLHSPVDAWNGAVAVILNTLNRYEAESDSTDDRKDMVEAMRKEVESESKQ